MFLPGEASKTNGYKKIRLGGKTVLAHRALYKALVGPVPDELDMDHLCRDRACVNVFQHLEPVTRSVNLKRGYSRHRSKTHCPSNHEYAGYNLIVARNGGRRCRACKNESMKRSRAAV